ncbi:hypothetical protein F5Y15DRAFT_82906 [Xylariaceae sp. FL0016]|nr:hypothetical protein F5Y15DRAFT_82906 [Xylariaceae sp. FL0016]
MAPTEVLCLPPLSSFATILPKQSNHNCHGLMATPPPSTPPAWRWSLEHLSTELIALILEHLRDIDGEALAAARLLSKRFNAIAMPIKYEILRLTERILDPRSIAFIPEGLEHIHAHTRHVIATSDLDPRQTKELLDNIRRLSSVRWRYVQRRFQSDDFWLPSDILNSQHTQAKKIKLYIEDMPLRDFNGYSQNPYTRAIPTNTLVSLKMGSPTPPLVDRLESLKRLLLESPRLETFFYNDRGQGTRFTFEGDERLPAFTDLTLRSYDWDHDAETVEKHWDFSQICHLKLIDVPLFPFLTSVPFAAFRRLQTLQCQDYSAHLPDRRQDATQGLYLLVRQAAAGSLASLNITCHIPLFPVDALLRHAPSLRTLRFRDHTGFGDEERRCPTLRAQDMAMLSRELRHLGVLELDMDTACCDPSLFLRAVCGFPSLRVLTLHTQTVIRPLEQVIPGVDRDRDHAVTILMFLARGKQGVPWRSITINVGGWRRVLVRRMGEAWREHNQNGVYAERCFVLEKGEDGQLAMREELPVEI